LRKLLPDLGIEKTSYRRQQCPDGWLHEVGTTLPDETITLMEGALTDADGLAGFNAMKADAARATLVNILEVTGRLMFIRKRDRPR
jgi:hypothetical protein